MEKKVKKIRQNSGKIFFIEDFIWRKGVI